MADALLVLLAVAFFGLCVAYVRGLDRLVRSSDDADGARGAGAAEAERAERAGGAEAEPAIEGYDR